MPNNGVGVCVLAFTSGIAPEATAGSSPFGHHVSRTPPQQSDFKRLARFLPQSSSVLPSLPLIPSLGFRSFLSRHTETLASSPYNMIIRPLNLVQRYPPPPPPFPSYQVLGSFQERFRPLPQPPGLLRPWLLNVQPVRQEALVHLICFPPAGRSREGISSNGILTILYVFIFFNCNNKSNYFVL